jgi:hypothetical protein
VKVLCEDYLFYTQDPELLISHLGHLSEHQGKAKLDEWSIMARAGRFPELVTQLLDLHYDPLYWRSLRKNYPHIDNKELTQQLIVSSLAPASLDEAVTRVEENENRAQLILDSLKQLKELEQLAIEKARTIPIDISMEVHTIPVDVSTEVRTILSDGSTEARTTPVDVSAEARTIPLVSDIDSNSDGKRVRVSPFYSKGKQAPPSNIDPSSNLIDLSKEEGEGKREVEREGEREGEKGEMEGKKDVSTKVRAIPVDRTDSQANFARIFNMKNYQNPIEGSEPMTPLDVSTEALKTPVDETAEVVSNSRKFGF